MHSHKVDWERMGLFGKAESFWNGSVVQSRNWVILMLWSVYFTCLSTTVWGTTICMVMTVSMMLQYPVGPTHWGQRVLGLAQKLGIV